LLDFRLIESRGIASSPKRAHSRRKKIMRESPEAVQEEEDLEANSRRRYSAE
jgi:hypothetical protein